jgi:ATP-dependent protease ClpP protease subunit
MPRRKRSYRAGDSSDDEVEEEPVLVVQKNHIYYRGEIKEPAATKFQIKIRELADEYRDIGHIVLHLTTEGGSVFAGLSMYEALRTAAIPVHVIVESEVCSAGTVVMMGAQRRLMHRTSVILVHALSSWIHGHQKPKQIKEELKNTETLLDIMSDVYRRHTKLSKTMLKDLYDTDLYLRHDRCLELGLVDEIIA